jgi:hypothetical protein
VDRREAVPEPGEALPRELERLAVTVDPDDAALREPLEHALCVATHAERRVDVDGVFAGQGRRQEIEDAVAHDRVVAFVRLSSVGHARPSLARPPALEERWGPVVPMVLMVLV